MKLGEALVNASLITREQLRLALERQVIFGGRIGTNIVELGILSEKELSAFLSRYFKIPAADQAQIASIDPEVIACIGRALAEKYKVVPFRKDRNRLHVAVLDPRSIAGADEIRFITGYDIIPYVITELRLLYALEKYYDIKRDLRYVSILGKEEERETTAEEAKAKLKKVKEEFANAKEKEEIIGILLNESRKIASRAAVFLLRSNKLTGWQSRGLEAAKFEAEVAANSVFSDVIAGRNYYRGPILKVPGNEPLISLLSGAPQDCLIIPLRIRDKIVALLYADNGNASVLDASLTYFDALVAMASLSFEIVILRKKILDL
jgi:hypothetical protein